MISVDGREPFDIQTLFDKVEHLQYGDFKIVSNDKTLLVERKTIPDMWNSLKKGRLNEQLSECDALLIHHTDKEWYHIDEEKLYDVINGINKHHMVWHIFSVEHLKVTLRRYERQLEEGTFGEFRKILVKEDLPTPVRILGQFPGIGVEKAKQLLASYGSIQNIFYALEDMDERNLPEGFGLITMNKLKDAFAQGLNKNE